MAALGADAHGSAPNAPSAQDAVATSSIAAGVSVYKTSLLSQTAPSVVSHLSAALALSTDGSTQTLALSTDGSTQTLATAALASCFILACRFIRRVRFVFATRVDAFFAVAFFGGRPRRRGAALGFTARFNATPTR